MNKEHITHIHVKEKKSLILDELASTRYMFMDILGLLFADMNTYSA